MALFLPQGGKFEGGGGGRERVENGRFAVLRIDTFFLFFFSFFSFFFFFFLLSLPLPLPFAILLVCEAIHARMVTNDGGGGVKMEKVEVAAMRSVEMIRTVEQVGGRAIEIFAGN